MTAQPESIQTRNLLKTIALCESLLHGTQKKSNQIGWIRFLVFFGGILLAVLINFIFSSIASACTLLPSAILFLVISIIQNKILKKIKMQKKWIEIKITNLARTNLNWIQIPKAKDFHADLMTPISVDLDITGSNSLHQLIDCSKSKDGSELLRQFLLQTPTCNQEIIQKQKLVKELTKLSHYRNKFLLINYLSSPSEINSSNLLSWLEKSIRIDILSTKLKILIPLCLLSLISVVLYSASIISIHWMFASMFYLAYYFLNQKYFQSQITEVELVNDELRKIIGALEFVENAKYIPDSELRNLCLPLLEKNGSATRKIKEVNTILSILSLRSNPFIWFAMVLIFPMDFFFAYKIERYKEDVRLHLPVWLDVLHNLEAFISIANFAHLNPDYVFPEILPQKNPEVHLEAKRLSHPLISKVKRIANDYSIDGSGRVDIFTGSNMSGKSTFLRTVGINICLANAGAPVCADSFLFSQSKLFTCIRVSDSVIDGISYFYAEVKRLKELLDEFEKPNSLPIMFLIDEIFKGTNNLERLKGSEAMIRALALKQGAGLISTHDLELVKLAETIPTIKNYHFKEEIADDRMIFDYKLRLGPCPTTNAIKIMKASGLPV